VIYPAIIGGGYGQKNSPQVGGTKRASTMDDLSLRLQTFKTTSQSGADHPDHSTALQEAADFALGDPTSSHYKAGLVI
jgi:hypothetical protein